MGNSQRLPGPSLQEVEGTLLVMLSVQLTTSELTAGKHLMEYRYRYQTFLQNLIQINISDSQILSFII